MEERDPRATSSTRALFLSGAFITGSRRFRPSVYQSTVGSVYIHALWRGEERAAYSNTVGHGTGEPPDKVEREEGSAGAGL